MERLNLLYFSSILNRKIYDEYGESIGLLKDIYVTSEEGYPRAIGYKIARGKEIFNYEFKFIEFFDDGSEVYIKVKGARDIIPRTFSFLLRENLLDKQIIDIDGKKAFKAHDIRLAQISGDLRLVAVDKSLLGVGRRHKIENLYRFYLKMTGKRTTDSLILWDDVEFNQSKRMELKINVPYEKLSTLHPADLADILEEVDHEYRNKIFESLDEELAAETLEEIEEPEVQAKIISGLSEEKAAELLEMLPNDEIADFLDDLDDETRENILLNMEMNDEAEVRELMAYEEELAGALMTKDFYVFNSGISVSDTIGLLKDLNPEYDEIYYVFVQDNAGILQGVVNLRDLLVEDGERLLEEIMDSSIEQVKVSDHSVTAVDLAIKYEILLIPVVDDDNRLVGVLNIHDVIDEFLAPVWKKKRKDK
jgi:CBS domain-containing protein/sporulation protein YlmC with PRC-barrel domain